jgi:Family of unknown function (DUF6338)
MAPQTGTALLVLAAFVLPGFITLLLKERAYTVRGEESPFERLLNALYYSSLIYGIAGFAAWLGGLQRDDVTKLWEGDATLGTYLAVAICGLFVMPLVIAEVGRWWSRSRRLRPWTLKKLGIDLGHSVPAGWEQLFAESQGALEGNGLLLRVTLEDGRAVAGFFGEKSLAGYTTDTRDIFLEERWSLDDDDWFEAPVPESRGLWISDRQIQSVEAYAPPSADDPPYGGV